MTQYRQRGRYQPERRQLGYLKDGYFDERGNIKCDLLTTTAEDWAQKLGTARVTSTQLRRFFIQVRAIERELGQRDFAELVPRIQSLQPLVANYVGRGSSERERQERQYLKEFIDRNVELAIKNEDNFKKGFIPHFESVVAYYKYFPRK